MLTLMAIYAGVRYLNNRFGDDTNRTVTALELGNALVYFAASIWLVVGLPIKAVSPTIK